MSVFTTLAYRLSLSDSDDNRLHPQSYTSTLMLRFPEISLKLQLLYVDLQKYFFEKRFGYCKIT